MTTPLTPIVSLLFAAIVAAAGAELDAADSPPYPPSSVIVGITWHWETHRTAAPGSDLWPVTWGPDGHLYTAWGDGGGFGGTNSDSRVSMGFARIEDSPEKYRGVNINGGKNAEFPASFPKKGKTGGILFVDGTLYARLNRQDGQWPEVNHSLAWSDDRGATWQQTSWVFPKGEGNFKPARFLNFGQDYAGVPTELGGYVYLYGFQQTGAGAGDGTYLSRVPKEKIKDRGAYEFFAGLDANRPVWSADVADVQPVFTDPRGVIPTTGAVYHPVLKRYLLTSFHTGPGQLGIFDAPQPWGPWTTAAYYETWGEMGLEGHGLNCDFPQKWISPDGLTMWCVFSVYGAGAAQGIQAHDRFNLVKVSLTLRREAP
ncbi:MAG TPA: DUF4185 domain-containing protein [Thermoguttaceae bacterium]|nr:DUF4185 domain-containing protein [Thermoguttaceae bacterium]